VREAAADFDHCGGFDERIGPRRQVAHCSASL
jgi:hypothetical protein